MAPVPPGSRRARPVAVGAMALLISSLAGHPRAAMAAPPTRSALEVETVTHVLGVAVTGDGSVSSSPAGISCPPLCSAVFPDGTAVSLIPAPSDDWEFSSWAGACDGDGNCTVVMDGDRAVTATFAPADGTLTVSTAGTGSGAVSSSPPGITCGGDCTESYRTGTDVTLTATPNATSSFAEWQGSGCSGTAHCTVSLDGDRTVTAIFAIADECTIVGTERSETLRGTSLNDLICGLGGNDVLWGGGGADSLIGGRGNDLLIGGPGNDAVDGRSGSDTVSYKRTRPGRQARAGVSVDLASRSATGKAIDRDRLARIERVIGTSFADALRGSDHADQLNGGAGEDRVNGRGRNDRLIGGKGRDIVHGSSGADELFGSRNSDRLYGDRGRDRLRGGDVPRTDDSDRCDGGAERDTANSCEVRVSIP